MKKAGFFLKNSVLLFALAGLSVFLLGWMSNSFVSDYDNLEKPFYQNILRPGVPFEQKSPADHIKKEQIHVYEDKIVIDLEGASWGEFTDTNSMDPFIDAGANSFEIKPQSTEDINVGDVISYVPKDRKDIIIHRVIETGEDELGWYAIVKGDNLSRADPGKIRFEQIKGLLVGVIY
ncbi:hypothetical protein GF336_02360 [Candidatus Woesearchaeota archaeon]|nr:hypothetical protein [Candidatus Woesearchaeota archaeon]